jgi:phosphate/sulfate permease
MHLLIYSFILHYLFIYAFVFLPLQITITAYGMASCLCVGTIWLAVASYYGWNVSSTHSIIGGIIGFGTYQDK